MSTSKLQNYTGQRLRESFPTLDIQENRRPDWLITEQGERLELDFWIDELWAAVEVQGMQHVQYTPFFHASRKDFASQKRRDSAKAKMCSDYGLQLFYVYNKSDVDFVIGELYASRQELKKTINMEIQFIPAAPQEQNLELRLPPKLKPASKKVLKKISSVNDFLVTVLSQNFEEKAATRYQNRLKKRIAEIDTIIAKQGILLDDDVSAFLDLVRGIKIEYDPTLPKFYLFDRRGTKRIRHRAKTILVAKPFDNDLYLIFGGEQQHVVWFSGINNIDESVCNCRGWADATDRICSHIYAAYLHAMQNRNKNQGNRP